jgi:hypothetical protein
MPSFCSSSIFEDYSTRAAFSLAQNMKPGLKASGIGYRDMNILPSTVILYVSIELPQTWNESVCPLVYFKVSLKEAKNIAIPPLPKGAQIVGRKLRVCVFDDNSTSEFLREKLYSNVHTISCTTTTTETTWRFPSSVIRSTCIDIG